jgi:hypothetical protein
MSFFNKVIRSVSLSAATKYVAQPGILQPQLLYGCSGDLRGERPAGVSLDLRRLADVAPTIISFRIDHHIQEKTEGVKSPAEVFKPSNATYGMMLREPFMASIVQGQPLIEAQRRMHRTQSRKCLAEFYGMYGNILWMPSTMRKGQSKKKNQTTFPFQRELLCLLSFGGDEAACFLSHITPDTIVNMRSFSSMPHKAIASGIRSTVQKLYDQVVQRSASLGSEHLARAPTVDVTCAYIRNDMVYSVSTHAFAQAHIFVVTGVHGREMALIQANSHSDSFNETDRSLSISSNNSFVSPRRNSTCASYELPNTYTTQCDLTDLDNPHRSEPLGGDTSPSGAEPAMATFEQTPANVAPETKVKFVMVLATDAFWEVMDDKDVWDLLYVMRDLEFEAASHRSVGRLAMEIVDQHGVTFPEKTKEALARFYSRRVEESFQEFPTMPDAAMAEVLSTIAFTKASADDVEAAPKMSVALMSVY